MTIVFGSPAARAVVQADRKLAKEEAERERVEAEFGGKPLRMWTVSAETIVTCRVAAPDAETAEEVAEWYDYWDHDSVDIEWGSIEANESINEKPSQDALALALQWAARHGGGAA